MVQLFTTHTLEDIISAVAILASFPMKASSLSPVSNAPTLNAITWKTPAMLPNRCNNTPDSRKPVKSILKYRRKK